VKKLSFRYWTFVGFPWLSNVEMLNAVYFVSLGTTKQAYSSRIFACCLMMTVLLTMMIVMRTNNDDRDGDDDDSTFKTNRHDMETTFSIFQLHLSGTMSLKMVSRNQTNIHLQFSNHSFSVRILISNYNSS